MVNVESLYSKPGIELVVEYIPLSMGAAPLMLELGEFLDEKSLC